MSNGIKMVGLGLHLGLSITLIDNSAGTPYGKIYQSRSVLLLLKDDQS